VLLPDVPVPDVAVPEVPVPDVPVVLVPELTVELMPGVIDRTVTVLLPADVGVPVMAPVDGLMLKPAGRPVAEYVSDWPVPRLWLADPVKAPDGNVKLNVCPTVPETDPRVPVNGGSGLPGPPGAQKAAALNEKTDIAPPCVAVIKRVFGSTRTPCSTIPVLLVGLERVIPGAV